MPYDNYASLRVSLDQGVAFVTLDHGPINLLDMALLLDLDRVGRELEADPQVKVVVLQSANPEFFIAHADLNVISVLPTEVPARDERLGLAHGVIDRFRSMTKPTIAKIEGRCRGGGSELALACDMRFAAIGKGVLCQPEVGVGIIPGAGGTVRLPRLVGRGRALEIILGCADFSAEEAERYGYINRALPAKDIESFVSNLATRIAGFPAEAVALVKQMVDSLDTTLEDDLAREEVVFLESVHSAAAKRRIALALQAGMQTPELEKACYTDIWTPLAGL